MNGQVSVREVVSFIGVGILGLISDVGSFNLGMMWGLRPTVASLIGFVLGATVSFLGNRFFTFPDRRVPHVGKAYTIFVAINIVAVGIVQVAVWIGEVAELSVLWLNVVRLIAIAVVTVGRFFSYRRWVFLAQVDPEQESPPALAGAELLPLASGGAVQRPAADRESETGAIRDGRHPAGPPAAQPGQPESSAAGEDGPVTP